jgi:hypothetical protein
MTDRVGVTIKFETSQDQTSDAADLAVQRHLMRRLFCGWGSPAEALETLREARGMIDGVHRVQDDGALNVVGQLIGVQNAQGALLAEAVLGVSGRLDQFCAAADRLARAMGERPGETPEPLYRLPDGSYVRLSQIDRITLGNGTPPGTEICQNGTPKWIEFASPDAARAYADELSAARERQLRQAIFVDAPRDETQYSQGRLRAIVALKHKPEVTHPLEWLMIRENAPYSTDHPDFQAGYRSVMEAVTP